MSDNPRKKAWQDGELYKLLDAAFPDVRNSYGKLDVKALAAKLECTPEAAYKWLRSGKLTPKALKDIVRIADGRIAREDLATFVFD